MYITYDQDQIELFSESSPSRYGLTRRDSDFRPTYLVRVEDMERVPGTDAKEDGYCALSYSWSYSGDINEEEGTYTDNCQHEIISKETKDPRLVKFEDVIQQICKDFGIKYIWYDKICIDQKDKVAKQKEIKQMHSIYREAKYTVTLVPELCVPDSVKSMSWMDAVKYRSKQVLGKEPLGKEVYSECLQQILDSDWRKRLWTLEEGVMSTWMVFVGKDAYFWLGPKGIIGGDKSFARPLLDIDATESTGLGWSMLCSRGMSSCTANALLFQAHQRTTTKHHDRAFALSHMVDHLFDVDIDYKLPPETVIRQFYTELAEADRSILCFGKPASPYINAIRDQLDKLDHFDLPSWTGVNGVHAAQNALHRESDGTNKARISVDDHMLMHIQQCRYFKVTPLPYQDESIDEDPTSQYRNIGKFKFTHYIPVNGNGTLVDLMYHSLAKLRYRDSQLGFPLSLTEDCDECIVLDLPSGFHQITLYPVIRQCDGKFKSIGVLQVDSKQKLKIRKAFETENSFTIA